MLLTNNRIEAAVAEVRFLGAEKEQFSSDDATAMLAELSERTAVTRLETAEQRELSFSFVGGDPEPSVEVTSRGWRFSSADENQLFTLLPNIAIVQVRGYERWSTSLRPQLEAMLATTVQHAAPTIVQRLGLRYINRLVGTPGEPPQAWARRIAPAFHGPLQSRRSVDFCGEHTSSWNLLSSRMSERSSATASFPTLRTTSSATSLTLTCLTQGQRCSPSTKLSTAFNG